jgi:hypothetical protein
MTNYRLSLRVENISNDEQVLATAAAEAVFDAAGVAPMEAAVATWKHFGADEQQWTPEECAERFTPRDGELFDQWEKANAAAFRACGIAKGDPRYALSLEIREQ